MKSLKPVTDNTTSTLIAVDVVDELRQSISTLQNANNILQAELNDLEAKVDSSNLTKQNVVASRLNATNANISNKATVKTLEADEITTDELNTPNATINHISGNTVSVDDISSNNGSIDTLVTDNLTVNNAAIQELTNDAINTSRIVADNITSEAISTRSATINDLTVTNLTNQNTFTTNELNTPIANITTANLNKAIVNEVEAIQAKLDLLKSNNKAFDTSKFVTLTADDTTPTYIEIPSIASGFYRIYVEGDSSFAITFINTETAPIVHYSKTLPKDIDSIYYDTLTNKWYVKTYSAGKIYYSNDDKEGNNAPQTFAELPIDISLKSTLYYRTSAKNRLVIMGDNSLDYGIAIQGVIEANVIKESVTYHQLFFYGDKYSALRNFADNYLTYEDESGLHYTTSETAGYLYHTDNTYRDVDNTETEALEKISYDGTTIALTIDNKYGQDEIEINNIQGSNTYTGDGHYIRGVLEGLVVDDRPIVDMELLVNGNWEKIVGFHRFEEALNDVFFITEVDDYYGRDEYTVRIYDAETPEQLPFIISFTTGSYKWDSTMNDEVFNSYSSERG